MQNLKPKNLYGTNLISRQVDYESLYYMYNGHGDVTALIAGDGTIVASYYYDAFGVPIEQTGNADNPFRYAGYEYDEETGLYYLKARFYDASIARFIQEDTFRGNPNDPLSLNLYTYVHNNPLMYIDPTGHEREDITKYEKNSVYDLRYLVALYHGSIHWDEATKSATATFYKNGEYHNYTFKLADGWKVKDKKIQIKLGTFQNIISKPGRVYVPKQTTWDKVKSIPGGLLQTWADRYNYAKSVYQETFAQAGYTPEESEMVFDIMAGYAGGELLSGAIGTTTKTANVLTKGNGGVLDNANFAQKTFNPNSFSDEGIAYYTKIAGTSIKSTDDLVNAIKAGKIKPSQVPIDYVVRDGNTLILNTRSSQALTQAGIPRNQWTAVDRTGQKLYEDLLTEQLKRNKLPSSGTPTVKPSGQK